jgi:hypothetical protein
MKELLKLTKMTQEEFEQEFLKPIEEPNCIYYIKNGIVVRENLPTQTNEI